MLHWQLQKLEDLTENGRQITYGVVKPGPEDPVDGVKFIRGGDIYGGRILAEDLRTITADVSSSYGRTLLKGGELVVSLVGNPGHVAIVPSSLAGANLARQAGLVALRPDVDAHFVKYFLMSPLGRAELFSQMTGSVQVVINLANLRGVRVPLPPLPIQRRIAGILTAYDDLIENSQRRIKILEEMARRLYREWFVHFRFPGREDCRFVESPLGEIPEGWEAVKIGEIADVFRGRSYRSVNLSDEAGLSFLNLKCLDRDGGFRRTGLKRYIGDHKDSHIVRKGDIIMAVTDMTQERRIVAQSALVPTLDGEFGVISMDLVRIEPRQSAAKPFFYSFLRYSSFPDEVKHHANGANVLHLSPERITEYQLIFPCGGLMSRYTSFVEPIYEEIDTLENRLENLRRTRDLLLPRLLSGQIDVEALPEPVLSEV